MGVIWGESDCCPQPSGDDKGGTNYYSPHQGSKEANQPWSTLRMKLTGLTGKGGAKPNNLFYWKSLNRFNKWATFITLESQQSPLASLICVAIVCQLQNVTVAHWGKRLTTFTSLATTALAWLVLLWMNGLNLAHACFGNVSSPCAIPVKQSLNWLELRRHTVTLPETKKKID